LRRINGIHGFMICDAHVHEGALLEAFLEWGRRGARGRGSQPRTRAAAGHRPGVIKAPRKELADGGPLKSASGSDGAVDP